MHSCAENVGGADNDFRLVHGCGKCVGRADEWLCPPALPRPAPRPVTLGQGVWRVNPQMGQEATPVSASTMRKLGQPLVLQNRRAAPLAVAVRRRMRRMELDRPAKVVVAERVIMGALLLVAFWRATGGFMPGAASIFVRSGQPIWGPERFGGPGGEPGTPMRALDRGRRYGPVTCAPYPRIAAPVKPDHRPGSHRRSR